MSQILGDRPASLTAPPVSRRAPLRSGPPLPAVAVLRSGQAWQARRAWAARAAVRPTHGRGLP